MLAKISTIYQNYIKGISIDDLLSRVSEYISTTGLNDLYRDYCRTNYMQSCFRRKIISTYSPNNKKFNIGEIVKMFIDFCRGSTFAKFDIGDGKLAGFLVNCFSNYFLKAHKKDIFKIINEI